MSTNVPITVAHGDGLELTMIDNRGFKNAYRCRVTSSRGGTTSQKTVAPLGRVPEQGREIVKTETLRAYDGAAAYTLSQGQ